MSRLAVPDTRRDDTVDLLHGRPVPDPYRWLEDPDASETAAWVAAQNEVTDVYLDSLASRPWFRATMRSIVMRPRAGVPVRRPAGPAGRYFVSRNDGSQDQDVWYVADTLDELCSGGGRLVIDPNTFSTDGTSSLAGFTVSDDGRWFAYLVSDGGSDWHTIRLLDLTTGEHHADELTQTKFDVATWLPDNQSFLYTRFPTAGRADGTAADLLVPGELRIHRLGTPQDDDELLLTFPDEPTRSWTPVISHDDRWLVLHLHVGTETANRLWLYPIETTDGRSTLGESRPLVDDDRAVYWFLRVDGDTVYVQTDADAPRHKIARADLASGPSAVWTDVVAERSVKLETAVAAGDGFVAVHLDDAQPRLSSFGLDGGERPVEQVAAGDIVTLDGHVGDDEVMIGGSSLVTPLAAWRLTLGDGRARRLDGLAPAGGTYEPPPIVLERRSAVSRDGTEVRYFLARRDDVELTGPRPTLLYGYGGFDIPVLADFRAGWPGWLAAGGVLAIANLRGGSELGAEWHDGGRLVNKQNVFDDFVAVAETLVADGVTTSEQLGIHGRSNGGLLVGAVMTQRPDLVAAALPMVGVLDMLRFHRFTVGAYWISDYGSPDDPEMFDTLLAYSPLHNVRPGTSYPATLVLTGDHDDRVAPLHSFKFLAALQAAQAGDAPILGRIEVATGHGLGKPATMLADEWADLLAFAAEHTGLATP